MIRKIPEVVTKHHAYFSADKKYRFYLYREWQARLGTALLIGLNPSTANDDADDPTINKLYSIVGAGGFGAFYMMNLFPFVSSDPALIQKTELDINDEFLRSISFTTSAVVFCWGNFNAVGNRDLQMMKLFPNAYCFGKNKNGSPKHPLYLKYDSKLIKYA